MARNSRAKSKEKAKKSTIQVEKNNVWDIFKFGESYTSLILGIIVVIVATITLITFVKGKDNISRLTEEKQTIAANAQETITHAPTPKVTQNLLKGTQTPSKEVKKQLVKKITQVTKSPTVVVKKTPTIIAKAIITVAPTAKPTAKPTVKPTVKPTAKPTVKPTAKPTIIAQKTENKKTVETKDSKDSSSEVYTVAKGDSLWSIAQKKYNSGYNWVDIQKANNLSDAGLLYAGTKLKLPNVQSKVATVVEVKKTETQAKTTIQTNKIPTGNYTIAKGDTLWDIAVRAYGDGYSWQKIAQANNLSNPQVIHSGNKIIIPRG